mmetsp:Transcript_66022/g.157620  ORF Transcript_66022/g.157620 Transcript_66022/m.157620 type:complete len:204 (-) Transcript_66022:109-720(-)
MEVRKGIPVQQVRTKADQTREGEEQPAHAIKEERVTACRKQLQREVVLGIVVHLQLQLFQRHLQRLLHLCHELSRHLDLGQESRRLPSGGAPGASTAGEGKDKLPLQLLQLLETLVAPLSQHLRPVHRAFLATGVALHGLQLLREARVCTTRVLLVSETHCGKGEQEAFLLSVLLLGQEVPGALLGFFVEARGVRRHRSDQRI